MGLKCVRAGVLAVAGLSAWVGGCGREVLIALHAPSGDGMDAGVDGRGPDGGTPVRDSSTPVRDGSRPVRDGSTPLRDGSAPLRDGGPIDGPDAGADAGPPPDAGAALRTRYDFSGLGTTVVDRVGGADGQALGGATLAGDGTLSLDGDDDFVDLPNGLISDLPAATIMVWVQWAGGVCWQRVFDFGSNDEGEGEVGNALTSVFVTPLVCGRDSAAAYIELDSVQYIVFDGAPLPMDRWLTVAVTIDPPNQRMRLYVEGELQAEATVPISLDQIDDENVWLGRSQWVQDRTLTGRYDEFRIYDRALTPDEIRAAHLRGPDSP